MAGKKGERLTDKQERFCQALFQGMSQRVAWIEAGYSSKYPMGTVDNNACQLAKKTQIQNRLAELRKLAEDASVATVLERKQFLTKLIRSDISKPDTKLANKVTKLTDPDGNVTLKVEYPNKVSAVSELNRMEGIGIHDSGDININIILQKIVQKLDMHGGDLDALDDDELRLLAYSEGE